MTSDQEILNALKAELAILQAEYKNAPTVAKHKEIEFLRHKIAQYTKRLQDNKESK